jgi:type IV secretion system protein VirB9
MLFWNSLQNYSLPMSREHAARQGIGNTTHFRNACLYRVIYVAILAILLPSLAFAEAIPRGGPNDSRVRLATYQEAQVYRLSVSLTHVTTVEFGEGESIRSIIAGDTEGFEIDGVPGGQAFAIKPVARGEHTNVTVYTNRRSYYFNVQETQSPTFYVVQFRYPDDDARPTRAIAQQAPNYNYGASTQSEFTPTRVWDDGTFTYFAFARNAPVPAIFRYSSGRERTVNTQAIEDGVIRVSGVNTQWVLRLGDEVVCIQATPPAGASS